MDTENQGSDHLGLLGVGSGFRRKMFVIRTPVYSKDPAQSLDVMLRPELVDSIQSLFECGVNMAITFFRMRFSSSSWALRFWSSFTYFAVRASPLSISTAEYCRIHFARADWETPYSLQNWGCVLPFW